MYRPTEPDLQIEGFIERLAQSGLTWEEMSSVLGYRNVRDMYDWFRANPHLRAAAEKGRENPNRRVEASLFRRATGFQTREVVKSEGKPIRVTIKDLAPDPVSCIFWLKNRDPGRWRDVVQHEFTLRDRMDRANRALSDSREDPLALPTIASTHSKDDGNGRPRVSLRKRIEIANQMGEGA